MVVHVLNVCTNLEAFVIMSQYEDTIDIVYFVLQIFVFLTTKYFR